MNSHKIIRPLLSILLIAFLNIFCFAQNTVLDENTRDSKSEKIVETKQLGRSKQTMFIKQDPLMYRLSKLKIHQEALFLK